jgi:hypothetical protein
MLMVTSRLSLHPGNLFALTLLFLVDAHTQSDSRAMNNAWDDDLMAWYEWKCG